MEWRSAEISSPVQTEDFPMDDKLRWPGDTNELTAKGPPLYRTAT